MYYFVVFQFAKIIKPFAMREFFHYFFPHLNTFFTLLI